MRDPRLSFRARILAIVLGLAVLPLGLLGLWLAGTAARSGEALLEARLLEALRRNAAAIEAGWIRYRSELLDLGDHPSLRSALAGVGSAPDSTALRARFAELSPAVHDVVVHAEDGREVARLARDDAAAASLVFGAPYRAELALHDVASGRRLGVLEARMPLQALRAGAPEIAAAGGLLTAVDPATGAVLLPTPFDPALLQSESFEWNGERWLARRWNLTEPAVVLLAAAPLEPFTQPFRGAARRGMLMLLAVALLGAGLAAALTGRLTASLERLAAAADAVAAGDLSRRVEAGGAPETARVARAFNTMTASLRRTLEQLTERESLAAVGEFAAALAHEIRNPLSSIQLDLQQVEERLPEGSELRTLQAQALDGVRRLDRTVSAALETARRRPIELRPIDLLEPVRQAAHAAAPSFAERGARLVSPPADAPPVHAPGDADALQRALLNILLNAAEALDGGGTAEIEVRAELHGAVVTIRDTGRGIPREALARVLEPFYTTRPGGTGIGLAVARRIVAAHAGELRIDSEPGRGTTVEIRLPGSPGSAAPASRRPARFDP